MHDHVLQASSYTNEWKIASRVIPRFDIDTTSSWWRSWTTRGAPSFWSRTPLSLVLLHFFKLLHLDDFVTSRFIFGDEPKIVCEGFYEIKDTFIFTWFLILGVGHYCWLHGPILWLPPNSKVKYLIHTIWHILDFLQLWIITMG